jgi:hypothetical protein
LALAAGGSRMNPSMPLLLSGYLGKGQDFEKKQVPKERPPIDTSSKLILRGR